MRRISCKENFPIEALSHTGCPQNAVITSKPDRYIIKLPSVIASRYRSENEPPANVRSHTLYRLRVKRLKRHQQAPFVLFVTSQQHANEFLLHNSHINCSTVICSTSSAAEHMEIDSLMGSTLSKALLLVSTIQCLFFLMK